MVWGAMLLGQTFRLFHTGGYHPDKPSRLDVEFSFTGVALITEIALWLPGLMRLYVLRIRQAQVWALYGLLFLVW